MIIFSDVYGHTTANYGDNAYASTGTISADPLFRDSAVRNYRLQWASPCVNTGTNVGVNVDYDGVTRPQHLGYDMGAYEAIPPATVLTQPATNVTGTAGRSTPRTPGSIWAAMRPNRLRLDRCS